MAGRDFRRHTSVYCISGMVIILRAFAVMVEVVISGSSEAG